MILKTLCANCMNVHHIRKKRLSRLSGHAVEDVDSFFHPKTSLPMSTKVFNRNTPFLRSMIFVQDQLQTSPSRSIDVF